MKNILYISILSVLLAACGANKNNVEPIPVEIPVALNSNSDAKELIEDMTDAVNACRNSMAEGAKFAIEQGKSETDSLTVKQGFKAGMFAAKMMLAAKKIEKIRAEALEFQAELSETDWLILETKLDELEESLGNLNPEDLGLSPEEIQKLKEEEALHFGNKNPEGVQGEENEIAVNQQDLEAGQALREMEKEIMQSASANTTTQQGKSNNSAGWISIAFLILVIVLVIVGLIRSVKVYKRKFRNASDNFN